MADIGTVIISGTTFPIERIYIANARVQIEVRLPPWFMCERLNEEQYRVHGRDGSMLVLVDKISTQRIDKEPGDWMVLTLPLSFAGNRAENVGA